MQQELRNAFDAEMAAASRAFEVSYRRFSSMVTALREGVASASATCNF
jgi:hypothetical protein